jgi:hypothetical protein
MFEFNPMWEAIGKWKLNLTLVFRDGELGGRWLGLVPITESHWLYKKMERGHRTHKYTTCLLPCDVLNHLGHCQLKIFTRFGPLTENYTCVSVNLISL